MATQVVKMRIQFRRDTTENWIINKDIIPAAGEPCYDIDLKTLKIGDGVTTYEALPTIGGVEVDISADGKSVVLENDVLKLVGFDDAEVGAQPRKNAEGIIEWTVPSANESMDGNIDSLLVEIDALQTKVETLETKMDGVEDGSVDAKINAKINELVNDISDDGIVNTLKELIDYVADHGTEASDMAADILALQGLVGTTKVSDQIADAISGKVDVEDGKGLSSNDFTDTLLAKLEGVETAAQANKIEKIYIGDTLLEVSDKQVSIPVGAGIKGSDEITVSSDGSLRIGVINFNKITQNEGETVIFDGGGALG